MPEAYVVAHITVTDPERYREHVRRDTPIVERFGGRFVVRAGASETVEGGVEDRRAVIEFPDMETARAYYRSDEHQEIARIRQATAESDIVIVEGA